MITLRGAVYEQKDYEVMALFLQEALRNIVIPDGVVRDDLYSLMHYCFNKVIEIDDERRV